MIYRYVVDYTPTGSGATLRRICAPLYGDDLSVVEEMESGEWYRRRSLEGRLTFVRGDYEWIMGRPFDGTFRMTVQSSVDDGANWQEYFVGTFSRADLAIDEDDRNVVLEGLSEGGEYDVIKEGKDEDYDLMKIMPDSEAKEVQGEVRPALVMVDYRKENIDKSDVYCGVAFTAAGYDSEHTESGYSEDARVVTDSGWMMVGIYAEAEVVMKSGYSYADGRYAGLLVYQEILNGKPQPVGDLYSENGCRIVIGFESVSGVVYWRISLYDADMNELVKYREAIGGAKVSPASIRLDYTQTPIVPLNKLTMYFHYIRATLLTQEGGSVDNVMDVSKYYTRMAAFDNSDGGLHVVITTNTEGVANGHRLVPGTGEHGTTPQYFAPPDGTGDWHPLAEEGWQYASMWYTIEPSVANGLNDRAKVGSVRWTRCWMLGAIVDRLLQKISGGKVSFEQGVGGSEFLYATENPLTHGEQFEYLYTQKSNVMSASKGESAARCLVRLDWFLDFMRNALNCYWWLEERNDGTYAFRVEHVEWFRRGGRYDGSLSGRIDLTTMKPTRNFVRGGGVAKRLDDGLHKYSYDMNGMTERYTYSWQGDGGSDAFKGNSMLFKAGWVERGGSESHEVDNIFADLSWLMLTSGTDEASSKNYDGVFVFGGYRAYAPDGWVENAAPLAQTMQLGMIGVSCVMYITAPVGATMWLSNGSSMETVTGTGEKQAVVVSVRGASSVVTYDFGTEWQRVVIHRIHAMTGVVYRVPNVEDRLGDGYLQNGVLAWPWLQNEYLHYDIPAQRWSYDSDEVDTATFEETGTVKMRKMQEVTVLPLPTRSDERKLVQGVRGGLRDSQGLLQTGLVKSVTVNMGSRNAELTLMYDVIS